MCSQALLTGRMTILLSPAWPGCKTIASPFQPLLVRYLRNQLIFSWHSHHFLQRLPGQEDLYPAAYSTALDTCMLDATALRY
jgi:hypothetical protein